MTSNTRRGFLVGAATAAAASSAMAQAPAAPATFAADLVLKNGRIITVDARFTIAQAIAIAGDRILAVGPDAAMTPHTGPATRVIDLKGKAVMPGITDGHAHLD